MDYSCYSFDQLRWAIGVGLPMIVIWVIGMPAVALGFMIKYRKKLEEVYIKKYLLLLYQGLKEEVFYWEFVNTLRKILIL